MLEESVDRTEAELGTLRLLIARACHVNSLTDYELENLISLVNDYEGTRLFHQKLTEQLERENATA